MQMVCDKEQGRFYVRAKLNATGTFKRTSQVELAALVLWDPVNAPNKLKLLVSGSVVFTAMISG